MKEFAKILYPFALAATGWLASSAVHGASPALTQHFQSTSGKTSIEHYSYDASPCGASGSCLFRGAIKVPKGFQQVEVFLSGFRLEAAKQADAVQQVSVTVNKYLYDAATGDLEMSVGATLRTKSGQDYALHVSFVVILTAENLARFTPINTGCAGALSCTITRSLPAAVPPGMQYIGLATQNWHIGSASGPLTLNTLSGHLDSLTVAPPAVNLGYLCVMQGGKRKNKMFCEWAAKVIAFDPAEMEPAVSPIPPAYTFLAWNVGTRVYWANHSQIPSHRPIPGFLDAFEGLTLTYQNFPYVPGVQNRIWLVESSADSFRVDPSSNDTAVTDYGIFLGTQFGNTTSTAPYAYQESRAFGFLK